MNQSSTFTGTLVHSHFCSYKYFVISTVLSRASYLSLLFFVFFSSLKFYNLYSFSCYSIFAFVYTDYVKLKLIIIFSFSLYKIKLDYFNSHHTACLD